MIEAFSPKRLYTINEVSECLKMSVATIRDKVFNRNIPFIKMGDGKRTGVRFYGEQLNEWLTENQVRKDKQEQDKAKAVKPKGAMMDDFNKKLAEI